MFKQKTVGGDPFGTPDQEFVKPKPLSVQGPDVHEAMKLAGAKDVVLDARDPKTKRQRLLCCCGMPGCGIGPMTQVQDEGGV